MPASEVPPPAPPQPARAAAVDDSPFNIDFILGLPSGVRVQHNLGEGAGRNWFIEGFAGIELIFPMAGGGIRYRCTPLCGDHNAFSINPGVDAYLLYNEFYGSGGFLSGGPAFIGLVTADVELLWQHTFANGRQGYLGVSMGAGHSLADRAHGILPVGGLIVGCRF